MATRWLAKFLHLLGEGGRGGGRKDTEGPGGGEWLLGEEGEERGILDASELETVPAAAEAAGQISTDILALCSALEEWQRFSHKC